MIDNYIYFIVALLPLAALMLVFQVNPYHALVIRAILGAVAALVYAILGAADVALTEALVGTMLAITLYVVAVRSSLVMRLGIVKTKSRSDLELELADAGTRGRGDAEMNNLSSIEATPYKKLEAETESHFEELIANLRKIIDRHHLRLELVEYPNPQALERALMTKEVHAICGNSEQLEPDSERTERIAIRVRRLFEIIQTELTLPETILTYVTVPNVEDKH
jgi:putative multicomponent Na+:H+ antiporter subunit B